MEKYNLNQKSKNLKILTIKISKKYNFFKECYFKITLNYVKRKFLKVKTSKQCV